MITKINEFAKYNESNISEISDYEIKVFDNKIMSLLSFIGEGINDIIVDSIFSTQTKEYTNTVTIIFIEAAHGNINIEDWKKAEKLLNNIKGTGGFEDFNIISSHNKIELIFSEKYPLEQY